MPGRTEHAKAFRPHHCAMVLLLLVLPTDGARSAEPTALDVLFPYEWVGNIDKIKFREPSGIVYHPARRTLFVVSDEGELCEIHTDGRLVKHKRIRKGDFEGVTVDPATGRVYIAVEGEERILEIDPDTFDVLREFTIERTFKGRTVLKSGGQGIEAITFVPDPNHAEGGTFFAANQSFSLTDAAEPSALFEIGVPLRTASGPKAQAKILRMMPLPVIDLAGLHYDASRDRLYVVSDSHNAFLEVSRDGQLLAAYAFPGRAQEGITVDPDGFVYIAQDSGGIVKIRWRRKK